MIQSCTTYLVAYGTLRRGCFAGAFQNPLRDTAQRPTSRFSKNSVVLRNLVLPRRARRRGGQTLAPADALTEHRFNPHAVSIGIQNPWRSMRKQQCCSHHTPRLTRDAHADQQSTVMRKSHQQRRPSPAHNLHESNLHEDHGYRNTNTTRMVSSSRTPAFGKTFAGHAARPCGVS